MKVLAINGSPRKNGNTANMLGKVLELCNHSGLDTELYQAGGKTVKGCIACGKCSEHMGRCEIDDWMNELYAKMLSSDAILLGSPTYFSDLTPEMKAIIDRCGYLSRADHCALSRKIGAAVTAVRRAGSIHTLDSMQHFFLVNDMIIAGSTYWNMSLCRNVGEFEEDREGIRTMERLAENMIWLLEKTAD